MIKALYSAIIFMSEIHSLREAFKNAQLMIAQDPDFKLAS